MGFTHLHLHTEYSLLDGACRIKPLMQKLKALGMDACAVTDHGVMYAAVDFYDACKAEHIRPIIGCEMYLCQNMDEKSAFTREYAHLILLCENMQGYQNLTRLCSEGFTRGFYYKPRIDYRLLAQHHEGLIALSACLSGDLPRLLLDGRYDEARDFACRMRDIMGKGNFYIEIMDHGIPEEKLVLPRLIRLADETGIPLVATNDCHYLNKEDAAAQEVLMCVQTGKTLDDEQRMRRNTDELYVKSEEEMARLFPSRPDALKNTEVIAERCQVDFDFSKIHLPQYPLPEGQDPVSALRELCEKGFATRYPGNPSEARARLEKELDVITSMGYVDYFLIVWDFIKYAKDHGIMVGPGRGSGGGSIVAYCLNITTVDPLKYNLLFERFLNPERVTMPDIDMDFCYERRQEVIDYVTEKYGHDHVAQIITFGTMAARGVLRDVGRVLGYSYQEVDRIAKLVPMELNMTLEKALQVNPDFKTRYEQEPRVKKLYDTALLLEGMPRHAGTHAAGILITKEPVTHYVPLQKNDDVITTQFPMGNIEKLGLLKMDFLGLRTLTVIRDTLQLIREDGDDVDLNALPMDDQATYAMIAQGDTAGVFQLEGTGMRAFLTAMKPACFEDIIAAISLYRPGPMDSIPKYIQGKQDPGSISYVTPELAPILDVTYGCIIYQEQVMQIVRQLAGYSFGQADLVRRAMAKKKHDVMAKEKTHFIDGAKKRGILEKAAEAIYDDMASFASYAFNKSHAACYGVICVQTAWLKCHYLTEYMAAVMSSMMGNASKIASYIQYCRKKGVRVLPPDVNTSVGKFSVSRQDGEKVIRFGLSAVKGIGEKAVESIVRERRERGPYLSIHNFLERVDSDYLNKRCVESLIQCGAFDAFQLNRNQCMYVYEGVMDSISRKKRNNIAGQTSLFDLGGSAPSGLQETAPDLPEYSRMHLLSMEKEMTGVYISGHPLDDYLDALDTLSCSTAYLEELAEREDKGVTEDGKTVMMGGLMTAIRPKATKKGEMMAFCVLEDLTGQIECLFFPKVYERYSLLLREDAPVLLTGRLSIHEEEDAKLVVSLVEPLKNGECVAEAALSPQELAKAAKEKVYVSTTRDRMDECVGVIKTMPGDIPVYFHLPDEHMTLLAPRDAWCDDADDLRANLLDIVPINKIKVVSRT